jgi:hypothetical protein
MANQYASRELLASNPHQALHVHPFGKVLQHDVGNKYGTIDHCHIPVDHKELTFLQEIKYVWISLKSFFCCDLGAPDDYVFDTLTRNNIKEHMDFDIDLRDIVSDMGIAESAISTASAIVDDVVTTQLAQRSCRQPMLTTGGASNTQASSDPRRDEVVWNEHKLIHKLKNRRQKRHRQVSTKLVVALVNRARSKYANMTDCESNRSIIAHYLRRCMKEYNFRDCDIPIHCDYATDTFFSVPNATKRLKWKRS